MWGGRRRGLAYDHAAALFKCGEGLCIGRALACEQTDTLKGTRYQHQLFQFGTTGEGRNVGNLIARQVQTRQRGAMRERRDVGNLIVIQRQIRQRGAEREGRDVGNLIVPQVQLRQRGAERGGRCQ